MALYIYVYKNSSSGFDGSGFDRLNQQCFFWGGRQSTKLVFYVIIIELVKKNFCYLLFLFSLFLFACKSSAVVDVTPAENTENPLENEAPVSEEIVDSKELTLLFGGDIMAHNVNYYISDYPKIWRDIKDEILPADLAFANIEAPIDTTRKASSWPNFNMTQKYVEAAIDAGWDVFSLCNNHTNDQYLSGIKETMKTTQALVERSKLRGENIYFSGLKDGTNASFTYNFIEKNGWKILFIPISELLNRPDHSDYINYVKPKEKDRQAFIEQCKTLRKENPCDIFIISIHTAEPEYTRKVTDSQDKFYRELLQAGADIVWANHAHIIKDRRIIINAQTQAGKVIMYANGNTISGQRTAPDFNSKNPIGERDNTGDGLLYRITFTKDEATSTEQFNNGIISTVHIKCCTPLFITTYINTADEFVCKKLNQDFVDYLYDVPRTSWAKYIEKRIKINNDYTKDYIEWQ